LPVAPDPATMTPDAFSAAAAAYVIAQKDMVPEQNTMAGQMNTVSGEVNTNAGSATASETSAATSAATATAAAAGLAVPYTAVKTSAYIAVIGDAIPCDTSTAGFIVTLPAGVANAEVTVIDYAKTFGSKNLVVVPDGTDKISGVNDTFTVDLNGTFKFHWFDTIKGWVII